MQRRKTLPLTAVLDAANHHLAAPGSTLDGRRAVIAVIQTVLLDASAYKGFAYLADPDDVIAGIYDETRRRYY